jgi:ribose transport system substrate-binding protein
MIKIRSEDKMKGKLFLGISLALVIALSACAPKTVATPVAPVATAPAPAVTAAPATDAKICGMTAAELDAAIAQFGGGYDRPDWSKTVPPQTVKIAYLAYENNPFWDQQKKGFTQASDEAKALNLPLQLDFSVISQTLDPTTMVAAIEASVVQKYDGIYFFPINDSIIPAETAAVAAGVKIGHIAVDIDGSPKFVQIGQDLFNAGKMAGFLMIKATGGKGEVGVITGQFGVTAHELRVNGFKDALKDCPDMSIVGITEAHDSSDETYTEAQAFMSANPDLVGLYMTAGGPFGAGRAVEEANKVGKIFVVGFDLTAEVIPYVKSGTMITIHQHEIQQNHDVVVFLYNNIVDGTPLPASCVNGECRVPAEIITKDNVDQFWPTK